MYKIRLHAAAVFFLVLLSIWWSRDRTREGIIDRYPGGEKKVQVRYQNEGREKTILEIVYYGCDGDTVQLEKPAGNVIYVKVMEYETSTFLHSSQLNRIQLFRAVGTGDHRLIQIVYTNRAGDTLRVEGPFGNVIVNKDELHDYVLAKYIDCEIYQ